MTRTSMDFPDPVNQPPRPSRSAPQRPAAGGLLTPAPPSGPLVTDQMTELRRQTELLKFIAAWVMVSGLVSNMALLAGCIWLIDMAARSDRGTVGGMFAILGLIVLLIIAVGTTLILRRVVFHLFKIRA